MLRTWFSALLFAAVALVAPKGAEAMTLNVVSGSVGMAQLCLDALCFTETLTFDDGGATSGTITVDGGNVSFDIDVSVIGFSGGPDAGVSDLELQNLNYVGGPVAYVGTPDNFNAVGTAQVTGTVNPDVGAQTAIALAAAAFTINCNDEASQLKCGIVLNAMLFPISMDGNTRYVGHTLNPTAVPEPQVSVMALTAGLLGLTYGRRKATS